MPAATKNINLQEGKPFLRVKSSKKLSNSHQTRIQLSTRSKITGENKSKQASVQRMWFVVIWMCSLIMNFGSRGKSFFHVFFFVVARNGCGILAWWRNCEWFSQCQEFRALIANGWSVETLFVLVAPPMGETAAATFSCKQLFEIPRTREGLESLEILVCRTNARPRAKPEPRGRTPSRVSYEVAYMYPAQLQARG